MEKWTQRELLAFHDELTAARTRARRIGEIAHWRGLEPPIVSMCERPSFQPGFVWDIRRFGDLKLYRSVLDERRPGFLRPGYAEMALDAEELRSILASLVGTRVGSWLPVTNHLGLDGTTYALTVSTGFSRLEWTWWEDGPAEWRELTRLVLDLVTRFKRLDAAADTPVIDPRRLRVLRRVSFEARGEGLHVGVLPTWLLQRPDVRFLLVVRCADMSDALRRLLPESLAVGPAADIAGIVSHRPPGIPCHALSVPDDDLAAGADGACFELDRSSEWFAALSRSDGATAIHVQPGLPSMTVELWAKRPRSRGTVGKTAHGAIYCPPWRTNRASTRWPGAISISGRASSRRCRATGN
jgi:hypothetical protein